MTTAAVQFSFNFRQARSADELLKYVASLDFDARELLEEDEDTIKRCVTRYDRRIQRYQDKHELIQSEVTHDRLQRAYTERGHLNMELCRREEARNSLLPPAQIGDAFEQYGRTFYIIGINSLGTIDAETKCGRHWTQFTGAGRCVRGAWQAYRGGAVEEFEERTGRKWGAGRIVVPKSRSTSVSAKAAYLVP
jgi:hypothetical protein